MSAHSLNLSYTSFSTDLQKNSSSTVVFKIYMSEIDLCITCSISYRLYRIRHMTFRNINEWNAENSFSLKQSQIISHKRKKNWSVTCSISYKLYKIKHLTFKNIDKWNAESSFSLKQSQIITHKKKKNWSVTCSISYKLYEIRHVTLKI